MPCNGNATEYCGGSSRLDVYYAGVVPTSSVSSLSSAASTTTSTSSSATGLPAGWSYRACYVDNANGRILINAQTASTSQTNEKCIAACQAAGYTVAGMEFANECYCGNALINGPAVAAESQCNSACSGNAAEQCGGANRMTIFAVGNLTRYEVPVTQKVQLPGNWAYQGCLA
ncbi:MAG: hypothetical protein Q9168_001914 [Polycauliona sp. 1 TL-2023]